MSTNPQVNLANRKITFPHPILGDIKVNITEVGEWTDRSFDVKGTVEVIRDQELVSIEADSHRLGQTYRVLSSKGKWYAANTERKLEDNGESFAHILLSAVEKIILLDLNVRGVHYTINSGVEIDLDIQNNLAIVP